MRRFALFLILISLSFAQYQMYIVRASDGSTMNLVYDDNSTSYKDNSLENPDAQLRICAMSAGELQNKYVSLMYADGTNPGDYIEITHFPYRITYVPPNNCVYVPLDMHSFRAWYPSIPFLFISDSPDMSGATRQKFLMSRGWLEGNYTITSTQTGNLVNITVTSALDDGGNPIAPDVNYLVVGLMRGPELITTDTAITSLNDPAVLSLGPYTGTYYIHINGIGPGTFPPNVTILTPQPITYETGSIPFTYAITPSQAPIDSCWYILDGATVPMPDCTIAYILSVGQGTHTLFLYANDTEGNIGSDSVVFTVRTAPPPGPGWGGTGGPHIGIPPVIPPAYDQFDINPENINIIIDYPEEGSADFTLYSLNGLTDIYCHVSADFAEYVTIEIDDSIPSGGTIRGTITVSMPPTVILDYEEGLEGLIQCVGRKDQGSTLWLSTSANIYLTLNRPEIEIEEITVEILRGDIQGLNLTLTNVGNGSAYAYNLSAEFAGSQAYIADITQLPLIIRHGESGALFFTLDIPVGMEPGVYRIPLLIYENGRLVGQGYLTVFVREEIAPPRCIFPDLSWTVIILFAGMLAAIILFKREKDRLEKGDTVRKAYSKDEKEDEWERRRPYMYALASFFVSFLLWALIVWLFGRCTYL